MDPAIGLCLGLLVWCAHRQLRIYQQSKHLRPAVLWCFWVEHSIFNWLPVKPIPFITVAKILGLTISLTGTNIPDSGLIFLDQCVQAIPLQMRYLYPSARGCGICPSKVPN